LPMTPSADPDERDCRIRLLPQVVTQAVQRIRMIDAQRGVEDMPVIQAGLKVVGRGFDNNIRLETLRFHSLPNAPP
jgi:hypothetical protein